MTDAASIETHHRLDHLDGGLAKLRRTHDPDALVSTVCEAVVASCGFDRAMLSRVQGDQWRPWRSHARLIGQAERSFMNWLSSLPQIALGNALVEGSVVEQCQPVVVDARTDPRVFVPLARAAGLGSYVVAPVVIDGRVVGLLHADCRDAAVDRLDRDILWLFADAFAGAYERAVLLGRLRDQRAEILHLRNAADRVFADLTAPEIELVRREVPVPPAAAIGLDPEPGRGAAAMNAALTAREAEVLALMATGATNVRIAEQLVIATGTVKSHVKQVLRKLGVENRAEAISRYLRTS